MSSVPYAPISDFELLLQDNQRQPTLFQELIHSYRRLATEIAEKLPRNPARIYLVGCGDSLNAGMAVRYTWENLLGIPVEAVPAMTFSRYAVETAPPGSLVIGLSQSGRVSRIIEALEVSKHRGFFTLALTARADSPLASEVAELIRVFSFPKLGFVPGTTSYMAAILLYLELAIALCTDFEASQSLRASIDQLPESLCQVSAACLPLAAQHAGCIEKQRPVFVLGSGPHLATAQFTARKFFEISQLIVLAQETEEYAHDGYSIVQPGDNVMLYAPPDRSNERSLEIAGWLHHLNVQLAVATSERQVDKFSPMAQIIYPLPETCFELDPVIYAAPTGLLNYWVAKRLGGSYYAVASPIHYRDGDDQIYNSKIVVD